LISLYHLLKMLCFNKTACQAASSLCAHDCQSVARWQTYGT